MYFPDNGGEWGPNVWPDPSGVGYQTTPVPTDIVSSNASGAGAGEWTGFLQGLVGSVTQYAIAKDAAKNGIVARAPNGQPIGYQTGGVQYTPIRQGITGAQLLIGALVVGGIAYAATRG